jgi:4-hydroxy-tetrahydrodipicolinate synthase
VARLVRACLNGSFDEALAIHKQYYPLMRGLMGLDVNPVPIKSAVALQGHCRPEFRLPLAPLSAANAESLERLLESFGLIP